MQQKNNDRKHESMTEKKTNKQTENLINKRPVI